MKEIGWIKGHIEIEPPKSTKKITGTRFASLLGLNPWASEFETWCAITKTYEKPFEDTIYTLAGKTIEPKQAEYMRKFYGMKNSISPTDVYGADYFKRTRGDFFPENRYFGGMWDFLTIDQNGRFSSVLEMKTTKRSEDWEKDIPEYYAMQAALYAYLLGVDEVVMVCSFLSDGDYQDPDSFQCNSTNTIVRVFNLKERYPNFDVYVNNLVDWWKNHVETGISPDYSEKKDSAILAELRRLSVTPDQALEDVLKETESLIEAISEKKSALKPLEDRYKVLTERLKFSTQCTKFLSVAPSKSLSARVDSESP